MTQEDKQMLLKDLSARLPYGVYIYHPFYDNDNPQRLDTIFAGVFCGEQLYLNSAIQCCGDDFDEPFHDILECKPYLRPMSSMTEEEKEYVKNRWCYEEWYDIYDFLNHYQIDAGDAFDFVDWLNAHHFDYRGLIEKGLALEAPEGMYNF